MVKMNEVQLKVLFLHPEIVILLGRRSLDIE